MKLLVVALSLLLVCGCAQKTVKMGAWLGETESLTWMLPQGTIVELPDGKRIELAADSVLMAENRWVWMLYMLEVQHKLLKQLHQQQKPSSPGAEM